MGRTKGSEAGNLSVTKRGAKGKDRSGVVIKSGFDGPMNAPWRKTVSIFKQPVTLVHTTSRETKKASVDQLKRAHSSKTEKPRQMLWAKSLQGLSAMVPISNADRVHARSSPHIAQGLNLAGKMEPALRVVATDGCAASLCSALHGFCSTSITGQTATKKQLDANPCVNCDVDQPFIQVASLSYILSIVSSQVIRVHEQDIQVQERRVLDMRKRLQEARKHFHL